ncbi:MAG: MBL fold metallo-hydrolase, partial [Myxococcota bacterium]|nr:MBL fold metallo-hydrolase [Myxococcota bacterium]
DVTDVLLTHLHFDHAGGATRETETGELVPTFPHATYHLQRRNLAWAEHPTEKDQASYLERDFGPIIRGGQLNLLDDGDDCPFTGIRLFISDGHTEGQQLPIISDGDRTVLYCGDVIPTRVHIPIPWVMGYDIRPLQTMEEKKTLLRQAVDEDWILVYEHDPDVPATRVIEGERGFQHGETVNL